MAKIGEFSDFKGGSKDNIFRRIENTPLQERFKVEKDGSLGYRIDIKGVGPCKWGQVESAGINRHRVGDEIALHKRSS